MSNLRSATAEFKALLDLAADQLPGIAEPGARIDGGWSRKEILGHLIDSAANNHQRFVRGQLSRELVLPKYEQERWVELERFQERDWNELIQFWMAYNRHLLQLMSHVGLEHLDSTMRIGGDEAVTLEFVMVDYVRHLKHHLKQMGVRGAIE
jgi:hypothetical protein